MGGQAKIGGTGYQIAGGKVKTGGTGYSVAYGKTKVGGTAYTISFGGVPADYIEVRYVKSTTTGAYITLPIMTQKDLVVEYQCAPYFADSTSAEYNCTWGYYSSTASQREMAYLYQERNGGRVFSALRTNSVSPRFAVTAVNDTLYEARVSFGGGASNTVEATFNGQSGSESGTAVLSTGYGMYLWRPSGGTGSFRASRGGFGRFRAYDANGEAIMDLHPCYRVSDNVAGFYDLISGTFLTNEGSGTLEAIA